MISPYLKHRLNSLKDLLETENSDNPSIAVWILYNVPDIVTTIKTMEILQFNAVSKVAKNLLMLQSNVWLPLNQC